MPSPCRRPILFLILDREMCPRINGWNPARNERQRTIDAIPAPCSPPRHHPSVPVDTFAGLAADTVANTGMAPDGTFSHCDVDAEWARWPAAGAGGVGAASCGSRIADDRRILGHGSPALEAKHSHLTWLPPVSFFFQCWGSAAEKYFIHIKKAISFADAGTTLISVSTAGRVLSKAFECRFCREVSAHPMDTRRRRRGGRAQKTAVQKCAIQAGCRTQNNCSIGRTTADVAANQIGVVPLHLRWAHH